MFPDIRELLPHAGRMVLLERVLSVRPDGLTAEVAITDQSPFCHEGEVGAWVGIEYMAQTVAAVDGWESRQRGYSVEPGFLLGSRRYSAQVSGFSLGQHLAVSADRVLQSNNGVAAFECTISLDGKTLAEATLTVFRPSDLNDFLHNGLST